MLYRISAPTYQNKVIQNVQNWKYIKIYLNFSGWLPTLRPREPGLHDAARRNRRPPQETHHSPEIAHHPDQAIRLRENQVSYSNNQLC